MDSIQIEILRFIMFVESAIVFHSNPVEMVRWDCISGGGIELLMLLKRKVLH